MQNLMRVSYMLTPWGHQDLLVKESSDYKNLLQPAGGDSPLVDHTSVDILELNCLRRSLAIGSRVWDRRLYSLDSPVFFLKLNLLLHFAPSSTSSASLRVDGARSLLQQTGQIVVVVYDNEPASIISYAISSKEYEDWITDRPNGHEGSWNPTDISRESSVNSTSTARQFFSSLDLDYVHSKSYGSGDSSSRTINSLFTDAKNSPHLRISFEDESLIAGGNVKFFVTCYFAKQFYVLRKKCCPSEVDFIRSLSRCKR
ncbi:1-phosphatidylinositol-3-phosphate 5-kinase [Sarracenia purpurea var. burkii]